MSFVVSEYRSPSAEAVGWLVRVSYNRYTRSWWPSVLAPLAHDYHFVAPLNEPHDDAESAMLECEAYVARVGDVRPWAALFGAFAIEPGRVRRPKLDGGAR